MSLWRRFFRPRGFVLVLGGGGARGLAHLGVLQALEEEGLRPARIVGVSIGALFGALYAQRPDAGALIRRTLDLLGSDAFERLRLPEPPAGEPEDEGWLARLSAVSRRLFVSTRLGTARAVADTEALLALMETLFGGAAFGDLAIPLSVLAVSFPSGEPATFGPPGMPLARAVAASMALPGVFEPIAIGEERYLDGGLAGDLPIAHAREAAEGRPVVAVNVGARPRPDREPGNVYEMLDWALQVRALHLRRMAKREADALIEPLPGFRQWNDFSDPEREIARGYEAAREAMPRLLSRIRR